MLKNAKVKGKKRKSRRRKNAKVKCEKKNAFKGEKREVKCKITLLKVKKCESQMRNNANKGEKTRKSNAK